MREQNHKSVQKLLDNMNDAQATAYFQEKLLNVQSQLDKLDEGSDPVAKGHLLLTKAQSLVGLGRKGELWNDMRLALNIFLANECWGDAVEACDFMYQSEEPDSIKALVHGIWLAIAFPIDPEHSVAMLNNLVDETPDSADGAAVAAVTAHYIVGLRASEEEYDNLNFMTTNLIALVAKRHRGVESQEELDVWLEHLQLKDPASFLPLMGKVLDAIVPEDQWWFDRDVLRARLPH